MWVHGWQTECIGAAMLVFRLQCNPCIITANMAPDLDISGLNFASCQSIEMLYLVFGFASTLIYKAIM